MSIFITGTDTDVGKTIITAGLAAVMQGFGYTMGVYKPLQSGAAFNEEKLVAPDIEFVRSIDKNVFTKVSYNLLEPAAPLIAAALEGVTIDLNRLKIDYTLLKEDCDFVIVEGAGGIMVPVQDSITMRDIVQLFNLPVLIVARPNLGTINHTILTIEALKAKNINILGVVISGYPEGTKDIAIKTAPDIIHELTGVKILGRLPYMDEIKDNSSNLPEVLIEKIINHIDIQEVFKIKIPKLAK